MTEKPAPRERFQDVTLESVFVYEAMYEDFRIKTKKLRARVKELEAALRPFAAIKPSTFHAPDGSEGEGYAAHLMQFSDKVEFTGRDLAKAREAMKDRS
jgi:hypothetical protein